MSDPVLYRHYQFPTVLLAIVGAALVVVITFVALVGAPFALVSFAAVGGIILALFGGLQVEVTRTAVNLRFGVGLIRKSFPRDSIVNVEPVTNKWWYGFGVRYLGKDEGWLWNVSGLDAVRMNLRNGTSFRIGTDDQAGLLAVLNR